MRRGVVIRTVINGITFDGATKDAMQCAIRDALIAFMAATAQAQAEATKEAQRAGIAHAKANGDARAYKGRKPSYSRKQFENAQAMLGKSSSVGEVARALGLTRQTVYRIKDDPGRLKPPWQRGVFDSASALYLFVSKRVPFRPRFLKKVGHPHFKKAGKASPLLFHFREQSAWPPRSRATRARVLRKLRFHTRCRRRMPLSQIVRMPC